MSTLFALGSNGSGQLGIGHKEDVSVPKQVLFAEDDDPLPRVTKLAAGGNHSLLLTQSGELYWSGDPTSGACGISPKSAGDAEPKFRKMVLETKAYASPVVMVAATWEASVFVSLDKDGNKTEIYSCGLGEKGELGQGQIVVRVPRPQRITDFLAPGTEVVDLAACMGHVVAVLNNGEAYGWGNGRKGQLGSPHEIVFAPRKIDGIGFSVKRAVCGKEFTCLLGGSERGELAVLGSDKWTIKSGAPLQLAGWTDVDASWSNIFVLKSDGSLQSWGRDDYSQNAPADLPQASKIAIGSEHAVALLRSGDVLAWGWGEHGNCGPQPNPSGSKGQQNIIASSKFIPPSMKITGVGAGCATSWVILDEVAGEVT